MFLDQEVTKAPKEVAKTMVAEAYSFVEKIKRLEFVLVVLRGSNISTPISLQLETPRQEIVSAYGCKEVEERRGVPNHPLTCEVRYGGAHGQCQLEEPAEA
jgi:hypothetical protein